MRIRDMNWMQVEAYLQGDDRCLLPLGSVEQHGYLSLCVDQILSERVAQEAAEPLGIPVYPALPYGLAPYFQAYPGSMTLRVETYVRVVRELLEGIALKRLGTALDITNAVLFFASPHANWVTGQVLSVDGGR